MGKKLSSENLKTKSWSDAESIAFFSCFAPEIKNDSLDFKKCLKNLQSQALELESLGLSSNLAKTLTISVSKTAFIRHRTEALKTAKKDYSQSAQFKIMTLEASVYALEALVLDIAEELGEVLLAGQGHAAEIGQQIKARIVAASKCAREAATGLADTLIFLSSEEAFEEGMELSSYQRQLAALSELELGLKIDSKANLELLSEYLRLGNNLDRGQ